MLLLLSVLILVLLFIFVALCITLFLTSFYYWIAFKFSSNFGGLIYAFINKAVKIEQTSETR